MRTTLRKALALMVSLLMLCTILPLSAMTSVSAATTVLSMDWSDGSSGFSAGSVVAEGPDGSNCLYNEFAGGWSNIWKSVSGVYQNTTYVITFKAKASTAVTMGITIQKGDWSNTYYTEYFTPTTSWAEYTITTNVAEYPTTSGGILFKFQDQGTATNLWVDDLVVTEYVEPEPETPEAGSNLFTNGDFETGDTTGWEKYQSTVVDTTAAYEGTYGANLVGNGGWGGMLNQTVSVENGKTYTLSFWYKTVSVGVNWNLSGTSTSTSYASGWISATSWTYVEEEITVNGDTALLLNFNGGGTGTAESVYVDSIQLVKAPEASFDGFLYNGDFEIGSLVNWTVHQSTVISADAAHTGSYGAHLVGDGGWGGMLNQNTVGVESGKTYTISMWLMAVSNGVNVQIKDGGTSGDNLASKWFTTTSWTKLEWTVTPTTDVICFNFCGGGNGTAESVYLDDILVVEEKEPSYDGYFYNGDFETGKVSPWTVYSDTAVSADAANDGNYGLKLVGDGGWGGLAYQTVTTLKTGKSYTVSMKLKVVSGGVNVQVIDSSTSGEKMAYHYYSTSNASSWTDVTMEFTALSTIFVLNFCGDGTGTAAEVYIDDVTCGRVGGEVYPEELHKFGGVSIRDSEETDGTGKGLAFKFDIKANNGKKNYDNTYTTDSAQFTLDDVNYTVVRMGAVMTNNASVGGSATNFTLDAVDGGKTINVEGKYLANLTTDTVSFAVRILDIPDRHTGTAIYARPYYVYVENGEEVVVYGNIKSNTYDKVSNPKSSIKILSIGSSFSKDIMVTYLYDMFKQGGYDEVVIGYLYMGGCSMVKHLYNAEHNLAQYEYGKNSNGTWVKSYDITSLAALQEEEWDYVTIHGSSDYIGGNTISTITLGRDSELEQVDIPDTTDYAALQPLTEWVYDNALNSSVKVEYNMIWAYSQDCTLWSNIYHKDGDGNYSQDVMYNNIITQTKKNVLTYDALDGIIPCGTSIQNGRTSLIGDNFNETDGYHLNDKYGDYTGALTWYSYFSGEDATVMSGYKGQLTDTEFAAIAEAVNNALNEPFEVTDSSY